MDWFDRRGTLERAWRRDRAWRAHTPPPPPPPRFLRDLQAKSPTTRGWGSRIHKIHRILHKWMNTISSRSSHYANMQNIKSGPIRGSRGLKFTAWNRNLQKPSNNYAANWGNICDRYNKFSPQITFRPVVTPRPSESARGSNFSAIMKGTENLLSRLSARALCDVKWSNKFNWNSYIFL